MFCLIQLGYHYVVYIVHIVWLCLLVSRPCGAASLKASHWAHPAWVAYRGVAMFFSTNAAPFGQLVSRQTDCLSLSLSVSLTVPLSAVCRLHLTAMNFSAFQHFHRKLLDKNGKHNCHRRSKKAGKRGREHIWKGNTIDTKICVKRARKKETKEKRSIKRKQQAAQKAADNFQEIVIKRMPSWQKINERAKLAHVLGARDARDTWQETQATQATSDWKRDTTIFQIIC